MWDHSSDVKISDSEGESTLSSEDERDIQLEILEKERDEANQKLSEIEQVSFKLLKELDVLETQFQVERSCRESAEALAVKVTKENKVLKRRSQALLPLIPELPDDLDSGSGSGSDPCPEEDTGEDLLLQSQTQIRELQVTVDKLLEEKMQLNEQVEQLKKEKGELVDQLAVEVQEKEAVLRKLTKQNKTVNKMKRVSQLVTEEFAEMSQRLELEQGLRQHAEVFAHEMLVKQRETQRQSMILVQSAETGAQLQQALEQISNISKVLEEIQLCHQNQIMQSQTVLEESNALSELQSIRTQLMAGEEEKGRLKTLLRETENTAAALQEEVKQLQDRLKQLTEVQPREIEQSEEGSSVCPSPQPPPPAPPPPPPPPPPTAAVDPLKALRNRKKDATSSTDSNKEPPSVNMKARAVDEMMERIKKGIVLKPVQRPAQVGSDDDSGWKDPRSEKRKSAVLELQGMLDSMKRQSHRRAGSRKRISRHVGDAELQLVLQRRRRAMGDEQGSLPPAPQTQNPPVTDSAASTVPWAGDSSNSPVLRRLKQNREKRNSQIRASACIIREEKIE
ncbi:shootin-1 [Chanos chanos]|uniref:Shootin-1 n=1 Tax=Chanos chanos TaxID=29144 RepID=A0A6J2VTC2_CHACN|nr:shootin-1-like [Chanos chanos]